MSLLTVVILLLYFGLLFVISRFTGSRREKDQAQGFMLAGKTAPWYLVALGMVGTTLSGVTFVSVPGDVGKVVAPDVPVLKGMSYMMIVAGYFIGYLFIALVLLPLYYRNNIISIYSYLGDKLGANARKIGSFYFILSRLLGSAARMFLTLMIVLNVYLSDYGVPFPVFSIIIIAVIIAYSYQGGLKTIVWTDTIQTLAFVSAVMIIIYKLYGALEWDLSSAGFDASRYLNVIETTWSYPNHWLKQIVAGIVICIVMTGLDQDMMQKNLACRNVRESQKNMFVYSFVVSLVNFAFVFLGVLLYIYAERFSVLIPRESDYFLSLLVNSEFGIAFGSLVLLGLIASSFSSADGTLTALTTSIVVDWRKNKSGPYDIVVIRRWYMLVAVVFWLVLNIYYLFHEYMLVSNNVISIVLSLAGYTYGPILALYIVAMFSNPKKLGRSIVYVCLASPLLTFGIKEYLDRFHGYALGYEILLVCTLVALSSILIVMSLDKSVKPRSDESAHNASS